MIIFLNGSINSGKSTIARILSEKIPNCANLEIDTLSAMIDWMPIDQSVSLNLENGMLLAKNFVKRGLSVVIPYPLSEKNHDFVVNALQESNQAIHFFTLAPSLKKAQSDTEDRTLSEWEKQRINYHYEIGIPKPTFGEIIDTTHQTPTETAEHILRKLDSSLS